MTSDPVREFLLSLPDQVAAAAEREQPITCPDPGTEHGRRLLRTLGAAIVEQREPRVKIKVGAPIVLVEIPGLPTGGLYHLPRPRKHKRRGRVGEDLTEVLKVAGDTSSWPTLCDLHGPVFVYGPVFSDGRCCAVCRERARGRAPARSPRPKRPRSTLATAAAPPELAACSECHRELDPAADELAVRDETGFRCCVCVAKNRPGKAAGPWTPAELLALYALYARAGRSLNELVHTGQPPLWQRRGYRNAAAAESSIRQAWQRNRWPTRRRGEALHLRARREGPRLRSTRKLDEAEARALHPLHWEQWRSVNSIAHEHAARLGLTQSSLLSQLCYTWKLLGLPTHERIEMTVRASRRHGLKPKHGADSAAYKRFRAREKGEQYDAPCRELNARGKPCGVRAMKGKTHCHSHDPERRAAIVAHVTRMRARSPRQDPANLTTVAEVQPLLRAYRRWARRWTLLSERSGLTNTQLHRYLTAPPERRMLKTTAAQIRRAVLEVVPVSDLDEGIAA